MNNEPHFRRSSDASSSQSWVDLLSRPCEKTKELILTIAGNGQEAAFEVPESQWSTIEMLKKSFVIPEDMAQLNPLEASLLFIEHVSSTKNTGSDKILHPVFTFFASKYFKDNVSPFAVFNGETVTLGYNAALRIFYTAAHRLGLISDISHCLQPLKADGVRPMAIFSGQASSEDLLGELKTLVDTYDVLIGDLFNRLTAVLKQQAEDQEAAGYFLSGFDIAAWIRGPKETWPSTSYIDEAPRSFPIVGLIQLLNYHLLLKLYNCDPSGLAKLLVGSTGHSQGIISAAMLALASTHEDFAKGSENVVKILFWIGLRAQQACPVLPMHPDIVADTEAHGEGAPSPMLSISGISQAFIEKQLAIVNTKLGSNEKLAVGLKNGSQAFIVCGSPSGLYDLVLSLRPLQAGDEDQSRVPHSKRKLKFRMRFLPVSVPFHSEPLHRVVPIVLKDAERTGCGFFAKTDPAHFPVFHLETGKDCCALENRAGLLKSLVEQTCALPVNWPKAISQSNATHILEFGPGQGLGDLMLRNLEGSGSQMVLVGSVPAAPGVLSMQELFNDLPVKPSWREQFAAKAVRANGKLWVDTPFSRLLGKPPIMVAGMTPCTVPEPFVSAVIQAGYHVELSGGGHFNEEGLRAKIDAIIKTCGPGCSITLNSLFLNPRLWAIQYPVMKAMRQEGYPIEGFCIAAGVPSFEAAVEIVEGLREAGLRHVSFKPGSKQSILDVVRIAKACPRMPIVLQWTGGRAGGHHSFEDFHHPVLETYAAMRSAPNLILVAGSGFGDGAGSLPYLTGDWSLVFDAPPMPFDGILMGSRMMVAAEGQASKAVKELIVAAPGIEQEAAWEGTYNGPVGGVVTVRSELGEPIHKIATRGVLFWKELDETVFSLSAGEKRLAVIRQKRDHIIKKLNADHQKVWFGKHLDGTVCDLTEMTYYEVAKRLGELVYVWHQNRWIDITYKTLLELFLRRVEERFLPVERAESKLAPHDEWFLVERNTITELNPYQVIEPFFKDHYPTAIDTVISTEDCQAFLSMMQIPWHKPVPFIPTLDDDRLEYWFKKDSLWQSEDVDAVVDQDAQRVAILHGPVAARYAKRADEPVKDILDGINQYYLEHLPKPSDAAKDEEWFGGPEIKYPVSLAKECVTESLNHDGLTLLITQPSSGKVTTCDWLEMLSGRNKTWLRALLRSPTLIQGARSVQSNRICRLFKPRPGVTARVLLDKDGLVPKSLAFLDPQGTVLAEARQKDGIITVTISYLIEEENAKKRAVPLELHFNYEPSDPYGLIREIMDNRISNVKRFYWNVWYGPDRDSEMAALRSFDPLHGVLETEVTVDAERSQRFCRLIGNSSLLYQKEHAPMDYAMVACWEPVMKLLFCDAVNGDLLQLVHLSNTINYADHMQATGLLTGQRVSVKARLMGIEQGPTGKTVSTEASVYSPTGDFILRASSAFFFREGVDKPVVPVLFERRRIEESIFDIKTALDLEVLQSKDWIKFDKTVTLEECIQHPLRVREAEALLVVQGNGKKVQTIGAIGVLGDGLRWSPLGSIKFEGTGLAADPVSAFISRAAKPHLPINALDNDGYSLAQQTFTTPSSNQLYSICSGDHNPIHTNILLAEYAGLPGTITHGLWTSASVRSIIETAVESNGNPSSVVRYHVRFTDMVLPSQALSLQVEHVGMREGLRLLRFQALNPQGATVIQGEVEARQVPSAYVFTGQGSQEQGMGMDLYSSSPIAKSIWDRADAHFRGLYGLSILEIVRSNPKNITVHFGGPTGARIRDNYRALTYETTSESIRLFPDILPDTPSYTFTSPAGLLSMTQFTQPALTLMELAAYQTMRSHGLECPGCSFAGHSLGEYAALASVAQVMEIETLVEVVFYRGMCMQVAVKRDEEGRSPYGMAAVNPSRVGKTFGQAQLQQLVAAISAQSNDLLLEIVNYNVKDWQYVVAGHLQAIEALTLTLNAVSKGIECNERLIAEQLSRVSTGIKALSRGHATIPLVGIDVPFHSSFLLNGVVPFRRFLMSRLMQASVEPATLIGRYIPNLTAAPFRLDKSYIELTHGVSKSPVLAEVLQDWKDGETEGRLRTDPIEARRLTIVLLCELLAYQFASPVRWVETQEILFSTKHKGILRLVEIGPAPILCGMAERTLNLDKSLVSLGQRSRIRLLSHARDRDEIYYHKEDAKKEEPTAAPVASAPVQATPVSAPVAAPSVVPQSAPVTAIDDLPLKAAELAQILVAQKTHKQGADVPPLTRSIKEIAGGKSTLQNELVGDLGKEFGTGAMAGVEKPEELSLADLGAQVERAPGWTGAPGKVVSSLVSRLLSSKMPSGFGASAAKAMLQAEYGLSSKASDSVLAIALLNEPSSRFGSEDAAKSWLRGLSSAYLGSKGIQVASGAPASAGVGGGAVISSAELEKLNAKQNAILRRQIELFAGHLGDRAQWDSKTLAQTQQAAEIQRLQAELDLWITEHGGSSYADGIKPMFSAAKARRYDSWWNWARDAAARVATKESLSPKDQMAFSNRADEDLVLFLEYLASTQSSTALSQAIQAAKNPSKQPTHKPNFPVTAPKTTIDGSGKLIYAEVSRASDASPASFASQAISFGWLGLCSRDPESPSIWRTDASLTRLYGQALNSFTGTGATWAGRNVLMTGCGRGSIAGEMLRGLLEGGAQVCVTTSSYGRANLDHFRRLYEEHGSRGSALVVVPFNQGSQQDVHGLVAYLQDNLGWELDAIVPFAAIPENGRSLLEIGSAEGEASGSSELAHRLMLTNVLRLLGAIARSKEQRGIETRPAQVILPLSPNHGVFGFDGLYGESKLGLETLLNRWNSESWSNYLSIVGAVIGWTRGTGLMNDNNLVAEEIEKMGVRTFSSAEMAMSLLGLMTPPVVQLADLGPVYADLGGAMGKLKDLHLVTRRIREGLQAEASRIHRLATEKTLSITEVTTGKKQKKSQQVTRRARLDQGFSLPAPDYDRVTEGIPHREALRDLLDLSRTVVLTGFGEFGPYGGARTRWEMEADGKLSLEGCIHLAWLMGLIRWDPKASNPVQGQHGGCWRDSASNEPVSDADIKSRYEKHILEHTGIRLVEPECLGYDPKKKQMMQEIVLQEDMGPLEMSSAESQAFSLQHGEGVVVEAIGEDRSRVRFKAGCTLWVPKALQMDRLVAGQLPTGWDARRYGVPQEIVDTVDPTTLYLLVSVAETLNSAGITDPYEFYQYVHLSELGNTIGSGSGGLQSLRSVYMERVMDKDLRSDVLQDTFINTLPAWVNLLLLSSAGPIKTPVGACGTALESIELAVDTIVSGKARVVIVGACDDLTVESATEFGNMGATSDSTKEAAAGREPGEQSRPMAASRAGFMESLGAGTQILMTAELALRMACPIYGVVACTHMAMDKEGRSIPAPGQGILSTARCQKPRGSTPRVLDIQYRAQQLRRARATALAQYEEDLDAGDVDTETDALALQRRLASEQQHWGVDFAAGDDRIAPLEAALARFGLTVDDIGMASCHGTGTAANDVNESRVIQMQFEQLGRKAGNMLPAVCQKHLTGHPKGPAAAWMLNGALQAMSTGIIPPNRNADSIEPKLRAFSHIFHPSCALHLKSRLRAVLLKSFGFGQVGGELLLVHPDYLLATLSRTEYEDYAKRLALRERKAAKQALDGLLQVRPMLSIKTAPPYSAEAERDALLNPAARTSYDAASGAWTMSASAAKTKATDQLALPSVSIGKPGVGIDVQLLSELPIDNEEFLARNFSPAELTYCRAQPDARASLAGRWAAKEAIVKALCSQHPENKPEWFAGPGAPLAPIQVLPGAAGAPMATINGQALPLKLSISHSGAYAVAIAVLE